jgi:hypothetical protein
MMALKEAIKKVNEAVKHANEVAKKLTTKDRKGMKSSTFCGPNKSFPVNDCKHVRAAKVYLKRSKFSADVQKRIASCINSKAKALGCPGTIPAKSKGAVDVELQKIIDSKIFKTTKELVDASIENEGMELDFTSCEGCE